MTALKYLDPACTTFLPAAEKVAKSVEAHVEDFEKEQFGKLRETWKLKQPATAVMQRVIWRNFLSLKGK